MRIKLIAVLMVAFAASVVLADQVDTWLTTSAKVVGLHIAPLPDGGASATADCFKQTVGGKTVTVSHYHELSGAAQTNALNLLSGGPLTACKNDEGL